MDMKTVLSYEWGAMMPEFIILGTAILLSLFDLFAPKRFNRRPLAWFALIGIALAFVSLISLLPLAETSILADTFRLDSFAKASKLLLLIGAGLVIVLAASHSANDGLRDYQGEFYYLFLAALLGAMMMTSSGDLITLVVGLELLSISSYILAGMKKKNVKSNEAALKYVVMGGISTAITLFGMSYLYGLTGSTNLGEMSETMARVSDSQVLYLLGLAFLMVLVGLSFKLATAPFHMWAPDVYEGAPTPVTAFLSVISKIAGFVILLRLLLSLFLTASGDTLGTVTFLEQNRVFIAALAGATMIIGNVLALRQQNVKRLLAYSGIAHAGYLLVAVATLGGGYFLLDTVWFYFLAYLFMNIGAFAVFQWLADANSSEQRLIFAGLAKRSPAAAVAMTIFLLSLAGIPGTAGFIGKFHIFLGALLGSTPTDYILASILLATTILSYVYYFSLLVQIFFRPAATKEAVRFPVSLMTVLLVCVVGTMIFGLAPNVALDFLHQHFGDFTDFISME